MELPNIEDEPVRFSSRPFGRALPDVKEQADTPPADQRSGTPSSNNLDEHKDSENSNRNPLHFDGLTTDFANSELLDAVRHSLNKHKRLNPYLPLKGLKNCLQDPLHATPLLLALLSFISGGTNSDGDLLAFAALLLVSSVLNIIVLMWVGYLKHTEVARGISSRVLEVAERGQRSILRRSTSSSAATAMPASGRYISVLRDNVWKKLPVNCLVKGDTVELAVGDRAPCELASISGRAATLQRDEIYTVGAPPLVSSFKQRTGPSVKDFGSKKVSKITKPLRQAALRRFRVMATPAVAQVEDILYANEISSSVHDPSHGTVFDTNIQLVLSWQRRALAAAAAVLLLCAIVRLSATGAWDHSSVVVRVLLGDIGIVLLPLVNLPLPLCLFVLDAIGNAILLTTHDAAEESVSCRARADSPAPGGGAGGSSPPYANNLEIIGDDAYLHLDVHVPVSKMMARIQSILFGWESQATYQRNPVHTLGAVSILCVLDREGVLTENSPSVEHVLFLEGASPKPVILDLLQDSNRDNGIAFEGEWRVHMAALKPLGLNCLLNTSCNAAYRRTGQHPPRSGDNNTHDSGQGNAPKTPQAPDPSTNWVARLQSINTSLGDARSAYWHSQSLRPVSGCLCVFAKEIGFDVDAIRERFVMAKRIHTVAVQEDVKVEPSPSPVTPQTPGPGQRRGSRDVMVSLRSISGDQPSSSKAHGNTSIASSAPGTPPGGRLSEDEERPVVASASDVLAGASRPTVSSVSPAPGPKKPRRRAQLLDMTSIAVQDLAAKQSATQLLSSGDPVLMLDQCREWWDGSALTIRKLQWLQRQRILEVYKQWKHLDLHCIAFGYTPVPPKHKALFAPDQGNGKVVYLTEKFVSAMEVFRDDDDDDVHAMLSPSPYAIRQESPGVLPRQTGSAPASPLPSTAQRLTTTRTAISITSASTAPPALTISSSVDERGAQQLPTPQSASAISAEDSDPNKVDAVQPIDSPEVVKGTARGTVDDVILELPAARSPPSSPTSSSSSSSSSTSSFEDEEELGAVGHNAASSLRQPQESLDSIEIQQTDALSQPQAQAAAQDQSSSDRGGSSSRSPSKSPLPAGAAADITGRNRRLLRTSPGRTSTKQVKSSSAKLRGRSLHPQSAYRDDRRLVREDSWLSDRDEDAGKRRGRRPGSLTSKEKEAMYRRIQRGQVFLGMAAMRTQPKAEAPPLVDAMKNAGVRFVLFSRRDERQSKAFADQLGVETDWNGCISLRDRPVSVGPDGKEQHQVMGMSRLPYGVSAIRKHIEDVDNVPLLVPLFADATPANIREMVRIYQEYGETVMCLGSSLRPANTSIFMRADCSASLDPLSYRQCIYSNEHDGLPQTDYSTASEVGVSRTLTSLPCTFNLSSRADLRTVAALIFLGRKLLSNYQQALWFGLCAQFLVFSTLLLRFVADTPPVFNGYQVLWLVLLIIPSLSFSLFFSPQDRRVHELHPDKNEEHLKDWRRYAVYYCARFLPTALFTVALFLWMLHESLGGGEIRDNFYWQFDRDLLNDGAFSDEVLRAQNYALCVFVFNLAVLSMSFVRRAIPLPSSFRPHIHRCQWLFRGLTCSGHRSFNPCKQFVWLFTAMGCLAAQVIFCAVSVDTGTSAGLRFSHLNRWTALIVILWPLVIIFVDELVKMHDSFYYQKGQMKAQLFFNTKLGMHSPK